MNTLKVDFDDKILDNTIVCTRRLDVLVRELLRANFLGENAAEVGVFNGGTARLICQHSSGHVFLFDTFTGLPAPTKHDTHVEGSFRNDSIEKIANVLKPYKNYSIYKGVFPLTNKEFVDFRKFSFVHLDVDLYESVKNCLEFFWPRLAVGGVIILDDYGCSGCPGARLATDEFVKVNNLVLERGASTQAILRK